MRVGVGVGVGVRVGVGVGVVGVIWSPRDQDEPHEYKGGRP